MMRGCPYEDRKAILDKHVKENGSSSFMLRIVSYPLMYDGELINEYRKLADAYNVSRNPSAELIVKLQHVAMELRSRGLEGSVARLIGGVR